MILLTNTIKNGRITLSSALNQIAAEGKPVEIDQGLADYMGLVPDPAVSGTDNDEDSPFAA